MMWAVVRDAVSLLPHRFADKLAEYKKVRIKFIKSLMDELRVFCPFLLILTICIICNEIDVNK